MGRLDGKVALISGGARGQGATEAKLFVREGAKVVFGDILDEEGQRVEAEIRAAGGEAIYVHLDVTNEDSWRAAVDTAVRLYGTLNILVNNAGIYIRKRIEETTEDERSRRCDVLAAGRSSIFPPLQDWSVIRMARRRTQRPKVPYGSSPKLRQCSMPKTTSGVTPSIPALLRPIC